ncbi:hypothetical protein GCM10022204_04740 [Microlunatus aurantiacus]|uniref:DinB-like domain-containing protein n=1 Tax=Microlunatus aurantiacus TaxID=446786 RepID=A0ABP7CPP6_9ACTN
MPPSGLPSGANLVLASDPAAPKRCVGDVYSSARSRRKGVGTADPAAPTAAGLRGSLTFVEPEPDTKDWTWTLDRRCEQCGFAAGEVAVADVPQRAFVAAEEWVAILRSHPAVASRPEPAVWSPLEYGAHVRDVYRLFDQRLVSILGEDEPTFANWDQDETARTEHYGEQDPEVVADELEAAALTFVDRLRGVRPDQQHRTGTRSNGSQFTVTTLSQYFLHDVVHHLWDVTGQTDGAASLELG